MSIQWEEPPARPPAELTVQDQLTQRPGVWGKVLTADKVQVSRFGGDLHRQGFEINVTEDADQDGSYSLYAQWNEGQRTTTVVRPGADDTAPPESLLDRALQQLLTDAIRAVQQPGSDPDEAIHIEAVVLHARQQIKAFLTSPDAVRRYLHEVQQP